MCHIKPTYWYSFNQNEELEVSFTYGWNSTYDWKLQINQFDASDMAEWLTFDDFWMTLRMLFWRVFAEVPGTVVGEGLLVKNSVWSVYYSIPISVDNEDEKKDMIMAYFVVKKDEKIYAYSIVLPLFESTAADKKIRKLLDTVTIAPNHWFDGYWVEESEMITVDDLLTFE